MDQIHTLGFKQNNVSDIRYTIKQTQIKCVEQFCLHHVLRRTLSSVDDFANEYENRKQKIKIFHPATK